MSGGESGEFSLALPFDTDDPEFKRGVVIGMIWEGVCRDHSVNATVTGDCTEMIMRIAEVSGLPFAAEPLGDDWFDVTIGTPEGAPDER